MVPTNMANDGIIWAAERKHDRKWCPAYRLQIRDSTSFTNGVQILQSSQFFVAKQNISLSFFAVENFENLYKKFQWQ